MIAVVFIALCIIWSSTWVVILYATDGVPPCTSAAVRFWIACAAIFAIHLLRRAPFPTGWRSRLAVIALGGPHIGVSYALVYWAEQHIPSGLAAIIYVTFPCFVAAYSAWLFAQEQWTTRKVLGLLFGIGGVMVVCLDDQIVEGATARLAVFAVLLSSAVASLAVVAIKRWYADYDTVALTTLQLLGGAITLTAFALMFESGETAAWTQKSILATLYLAIFGSAIAFFGFYWLLKRVEGTVASMITFVFPVLAVLWGWLLEGEDITWKLFVGGVLVLIGVRLVVRSAPKNPPPKSTQITPQPASAVEV